MRRLSEGGDQDTEGGRASVSSPRESPEVHNQARQKKRADWVAAAAGGNMWLASIAGAEGGPRQGSAH